MEIIRCPHCDVRIIPKNDGECPACGYQMLLVPDDEATADTPMTDPPTGEEPATSEDLPPLDLEPVELEPLASPAMALVPAFGWLVSLFAAQTVAAVMIVPLVLAIGGFQLSQRYVVMIAALVVADLVMLTLSLINLKPDPPRQLSLRPINPFHLLLVVLLTVPTWFVCQAVGNRVAEVIDRAFPAAEPVQAAATPDGLPALPLGYTSYLDELFEALGDQPWYLGFVVICLLPGVCEELFFRGFLGRGLLARYGPVGGIAATSLLFGLFHIDPIQVSYTIVLGIVLHCVYLWSRSLWGPMILHILFNSTSLLACKLQYNGIYYFGGPDEVVQVPFYLTAASCLAIVAIAIVMKQTKVVFQSADRDQTEWNPGYCTTVTPPESFAGVATQENAGRKAIVAACVACVIFGWALYYPAADWLNPQTASAHVNRGQRHVEQQEFEEAVIDFSQAIDADPTLAEAYRSRAEAYRVLGHYQASLDDTTKAIELDPTQAMFYADRGEALRMLERREEALRDCDRAVELDPELPWAYVIRGGIHSDNGDSPAAITDYRKAIQLDSSNAWAYYGLGYELANDLDAPPRVLKEALWSVETACELSEWSDPDMIAALAMLHAESNRIDQAIEYMKMAIKRAPLGMKGEYRAMLEDLERQQLADRLD
ncbi:tetratricopeptide repeat protein [Aeoliella sp. ICT_H6.2]|uniref:Tetratricopeptide repeat protein n=1 Tax=Aeoliella straminimaris TaxID=2954799 RepID=A0A9X2FEG4_9BACT|nr:tetratricopeptide repeat protein [Aeoliella straminimaris]MCO6046673.1 tetratricopeptide repeat protein [Aeoliella straminimaris]